MLKFFSIGVLLLVAVLSFVVIKLLNPSGYKPDSHRESYIDPEKMKDMLILNYKDMHYDHQGQTDRRLY